MHVRGQHQSGYSYFLSSAHRSDISGGTMLVGLVRIEKHESFFFLWSLSRDDSGWAGTQSILAGGYLLHRSGFLLPDW